MGRRKIEIQPITQERNRSVTFLKRKNGLFKKAYELGVLCSVDIAVIVFEERPGHQTKLYQYSSRDVQSIIQRHLRYDGDKDCRGPADFTGSGSGDGDDDDQDEEEDSPPKKRKVAKGGSGNNGNNGNNTSNNNSEKKTGTESNSAPDPDYTIPQRPMTLPPPPISSHLSGVASLPSLPISSDRQTVMQHHLNRWLPSSDPYSAFSSIRGGGDGNSFYPIPPSFVSSPFDFASHRGGFGGSMMHQQQQQQIVPGTDDLFAFLDNAAEGHRRSGRAEGATLEWPIHGTNPPNSSDTSSAINWLDSLSILPPTIVGRSAESWERGAPPSELPSSSGTGAAAGASGGGSSQRDSPKPTAASGKRSVESPAPTSTKPAKAVAVSSARKKESDSGEASMDDGGKKDNDGS